MNEYCVYVLKSIKTGKFYIGYCSDIEKRMKEHNRGKTKSTKSDIPWELIRKELFSTKSEAYKREKQIKSYKSGKAFKKLIG